MTSSIEFVDFLLKKRHCLLVHPSLVQDISMMSRTLVIIGLLSLTHAAFSAAQHRSYLRLVEQDFSGFLPADILIQTVLSLVITMIGVVYSSGSFKEIRALDDSKYKSIETIVNRPSFYTFNHRGRLLS